LLSCGTKRAAASKLGMSEQAIYERMKAKEFIEVYDEAKAEVLRQAVAEIGGALSGAIATVAEIMNNPLNPPHIRLQAAQGIINNVVKLSGSLAEHERAAQERREKESNPFNIFGS